MKIHISSQANKDEAIKAMFDLSIDGAYEVCIKKLPKTRTNQQNKALHLYFKMLADELKKSYTIQQVLEKTVEREWTQNAVKYLLWRPIQKAITGRESTAEADTIHYMKIYNTLGHHLDINFNIRVPWPNKGDK